MNSLYNNFNYCNNTNIIPIFSESETFIYDIFNNSSNNSAFILDTSTNLIKLLKNTIVSFFNLLYEDKSEETYPASKDTVDVTVHNTFFAPWFCYSLGFLGHTI
jgi:hypothetical protein